VSAAKKIILLLWLVILASLGNVSALTPGTTETCVWQKSLATVQTRQAEPLETAGRHQENGSRSYEVAPDSLLAADGTMATQEGLINISQHLAQGVDYGIEPANIAMYGRLTDAFEAGEPLTGIDANFYEHELIESSLVDAGMNPAAAHVAALNIQGIKNTAAAPAQLYQPNIILKYSESFNSAAHP
jgi:hypothetical protein